jgi:hypothetical protein
MMIIIIIIIIIINCNNNFSREYWAIFGTKSSRPPGVPDYRNPDYRIPNYEVYTPLRLHVFQVF